MGHDVSLADRLLRVTEDQSGRKDPTMWLLIAMGLTVLDVFNTIWHMLQQPAGFRSETSTFTFLAIVTAIAPGKRIPIRP